MCKHAFPKGPVGVGMGWGWGGDGGGGGGGGATCFQFSIAKTMFTSVGSGVKVS